MSNTPDVIADRVISEIKKHLAESRRQPVNESIKLTTQFRELDFQPDDELVVGASIAKAFDVPMPPSTSWPDTVAELIMIVERRVRRELTTVALAKSFFGEDWEFKPNNYTVSGQKFLERIKQLNPTRVLDVGCGFNDNKAKFGNCTFIGIDIANQRADIVIDFLRYQAHKPFDVIFALGSINFGSAEDILDELRHACSMLTTNGRIFMRVNPGIKWPKCPELEIYPWSPELIHAHGRTLGLELEVKSMKSPDKPESVMSSPISEALSRHRPSAAAPAA
jgi:hypothetical protein